MTEPIHFSELERMLADDATPDAEIARFLIPAPLRALPLAPVVTVDETKVQLPGRRGIVGLSVKSLNDRANRKRAAAFAARLRDGWTGVKLLAEGDSWFLYPILLKDVVDNLSADYAIYSVAAAGDTFENILRDTSHVEAVIKDNHIDGLLLSVGGNGIAGDLLESYLTVNALPLKPAASYLNARFDQYVAEMRGKLEGLVERLTSQFPHLSIFCHGYDWPLPRQPGLWLAPAMAKQRVPDAVQPAVLKLMIDRYYAMLFSLAEKHAARLHVVDCRGAIGAPGEWFDELHPMNAGFARVAERFRATINQVFGISRSVRLSSAGARVSWRPLAGVNGVTGSADVELGSIVTVGRKGDVDIVIDDERISRTHVRLEVREKTVVFTDLKSTNGTLLDDRRRLGATVWKPGEKLQIGNHVLDLEFGSDVREVLSPPDGAPAGSSPSVAKTGGLTSPPITRPQGAPGYGSGKAPTAGNGSAPVCRVDLALSPTSIADAASEVLVVGVFEHINPTGRQGGALAIDAKLGGRLSTMVQTELFERRLGEISIVPLPADAAVRGAIAFAGLGGINAFNTSVLEIVGERLAAALVKSGAGSVATVPIGTGSGLSVREFLTGFLAGYLRGLQRSADRTAIPSLAICEIDPERRQVIADELAVLAGEGFFSRLGCEVTVSKHAAADVARNRSEPVASSPPASPVYLQVQRAAENMFEYCILAADFGAAIQLHQKEIGIADQQRAADLAASLQRLDAATGSSLASIYVPADMQDLICRSLEKTTSHLVVIHDQASSMIPWEAFYFKNLCPALDVGVSRLYRITNQSHKGGRPILDHDATLRMLVVENPTGDLAGAQSEGEQLAELYQSNRGKVTTLRGADATRANVLTELSSGVYDILHYAGHADFDETSPSSSGLILRDGRLTSADLLEPGIAPQMIFLNACESGRLRSTMVRPAEDNAKGSRFAGQVSLAESFLLNGIANFVGTFWPVNDAAASRFAHVFYAGLLGGRPLGLAMRDARQAAKSVSARDWANYLHFGDPLYVMRHGSAAPHA